MASHFFSHTPPSATDNFVRPVKTTFNGPLTSVLHTSPACKNHSDMGFRLTVCIQLVGYTHLTLPRLLKLFPWILFYCWGLVPTLSRVTPAGSCRSPGWEDTMLERECIDVRMKRHSLQSFGVVRCCPSFILNSVLIDSTRKVSGSQPQRPEQGPKRR